MINNDKHGEDGYISGYCTLSCVWDSASRNKIIFFFTNVVHLLVVVGSWEPCFPESQRCPAAAELPDDPRGGGQPRSPPVPCVGAEFLDLPLPNTVPPTKSFCCQREESHTLPPAQLLRTTQLLVILD